MLQPRVKHQSNASGPLRHSATLTIWNTETPNLNLQNTTWMVQLYIKSSDHKSMHLPFANGNVKAVKIVNKTRNAMVLNAISGDINQMSSVSFVTRGLSRRFYLSRIDPVAKGSHRNNPAHICGVHRLIGFHLTCLSPFQHHLKMFTAAVCIYFFLVVCELFLP